MAKSRNKRRRNRSGPPPSAAAPKVHVKIAVGSTDLAVATQLVKPAVLYADAVTVFSPAASMLQSFTSLEKLTRPQDQIAWMLEMSHNVPHFGEQLQIDADTREKLNIVLATDRRSMKRTTNSAADRRVIDELFDRMDAMDDVWQQIPEILADTTAKMGAEELLVAVNAKAIRVADVLVGSEKSMVFDSLRAAVGDDEQDSVEDLMNAFMTRLVQIVTEPKTFPLFDADSSGLIRGVDELSDVPMHRSSEITAAASFMGFLPHFAEMRMDEILDLRREISKPLKRFRAAVGRLSREFESRSIDESFNDDVFDAWRLDIEPTLADIREAFAEQSLLREVASVSLGDPRRLAIEAGGVVVAAHQAVPSLSSALTTAAAVGLPAADVLGRALQQQIAQRRTAKRSSFYLLHQIGDAARRSAHR